MKSRNADYKNLGLSGRSREGAWIEICGQCLGCRLDKGRSREGAWIEIVVTFGGIINFFVAPARERGLKYELHQKLTKCLTSLPRGSVD